MFSHFPLSDIGQNADVGSRTLNFLSCFPFLKNTQISQLLKLSESPVKRVSLWRTMTLQRAVPDDDLSSLESVQPVSHSIAGIFCLVVFLFYSYFQMLIVLH